MSVIDNLIDNIMQKKNPSVIGLDPILKFIPNCYKEGYFEYSAKTIADMIAELNRDIIDTIAPYVPAVKPQMAFYEMYGSHGVCAFEETVHYAKAKGLIVIEDAKRNDISSTARAYADGHLGKITMIDGCKNTGYDVDFLTVTPFLGKESIEPFVNVCQTYNKGLFVLVKTSNSTAGQVQDALTGENKTVSHMLASFVSEYARNNVGIYGYSSIGAVVGATYPEDAKILRLLMPKSYFLVPGYGAQGANAYDVMNCFDDCGLGAIVNSSRGVLYSYMTEKDRNSCSKIEYLCSVRDAVIKMQNDLYQTLKQCKPNMKY